MRVIETGISKPGKFIIYGAPGVGKSRLGASFPRPYFIRSEDRHDHLKVQASPIIDTWELLNETLDDLIRETHDFKTVIIDTVDSLEKVLHEKVLRGSGTTDILHPKIFPFYSGFAKAAILFDTEILPKLQELNESKKMIPVLISHFNTDYVTHPELGQYPQYVPGADKRLAKKLFKWCDVMAMMDTVAVKKDDIVKTSGQRILRFKSSFAALCKESYNLPETLEIPEDAPGELKGFSVIAAAIKAGLAQRATGDLGAVVAEKDSKKITKE